MLDFVVSHRVLGVPYVVRDELLNLRFPRRLQIVVGYVLDLIHKALNILYKDVVSRDKYSLLLIG